MTFKNPMLVVTDIDRSVAFYKKVLGLHVILDFGANKTLTGGLALQTEETYKEFIGSEKITYGSNSFEVYFEEDNFDAFAEKLEQDFYVLPSSVHETILVPAGKGTDKDTLREIVTDINRTQVAEDEVLADSVYYYSRSKDQLIWIA